MGRYFLVLAGGRGDRTRTDDFMYPKHALYQAELRPAGLWEMGRILYILAIVKYEILG